ncbi:MAG: hypothetical protein NWF01_06625 [Candidatus Bathyarchaeota archaeon]|nr:hypothetical protein [Candidatus Bathyarchaeota archaeon]
MAKRKKVAAQKPAINPLPEFPFCPTDKINDALSRWHWEKRKLLSRNSIPSFLCFLQQIKDLIVVKY